MPNLAGSLLIDIEREELIPLHDAPKHPLLRRGRRPGRPIHRATVERWRTRGVRGVVLETVRIGGLRFTSAEAITRFIARTNTDGADSETTTADQIKKEHQRAEAALEAAGI